MPAGLQEIAKVIDRYVSEVEPFQFSAAGAQLLHRNGNKVIHAQGMRFDIGGGKFGAGFEITLPSIAAQLNLWRFHTFHPRLSPAAPEGETGPRPMVSVVCQFPSRSRR